MSDVAGWLSSLDLALGREDGAAVADLFLPTGLWRDFLAFDWTLATHEGTAAIAAFAGRQVALTRARNWVTSADAGASEGFISFETAAGTCQGYLRLVDGKALSFFTVLDDLRGHEFPVRSRRHTGMVGDAQGRNWADLRTAERAEMGVTRQPYVLVVGAGQSGLAIGATLQLLGVPHLLIDKHPRVGDQWRSRYKSLTLHDPVWYDHMPYLPFPDHWPVYTPKDKMGDWLEFYANAMELNVWTETELVSARHDAAAGTWHATVRRNGEDIVLQPTQLVMALGNAGFARQPEIAGQDLFQGQQYHSSAHPGGAGMAGKRVIVVGANNSAHDICADLVEHGAQATMVQRSSTHIVRQSTMTDVLLKPVFSQEAVEAGITTDRADLLTASVPIRLQEQVHRQAWAEIRKAEAPFYDRLEKAGFKLDFAEDGAGISGKYLRSASGYYIDVGACEMVANGRIALKSGSEITHLTKTGMAFADGSHIEADVIVYATGFGAMEEWVARLIGEDVAAKIGRCWGYGSGFKGDPGPWEGELRNMWKPTAQDGLWFMGGNLAQVRFYCKLLGLQLKARFEGIVRA
ncbi:flavin-containing monooxygenase [Novosphingobium cyanobacteriorum]|uniref:NAD(P)/FAD-dependent oxidoreductase n=1 Tax=Novosphingobium cyanobacteriorum TaxID=3024215 RepID=A0ABT6CMQ1_9SPHN|nr:NAD(P)/FAD-dependent oxidoreductase [Novosphingobium cyanobacteriorum]MDF8334350.1 NAD(P)/FAD-dependent oxidoreductase [Novosphingobium cyanobacteriorum]